MKRRYAVLGLSVFLALALAVPALGGPSNPVAGVSADALTIAKKALKKAKAAQKTANAAQSAASGAQNTANTALTEAKKGVSAAAAAQTSANNAQASADSAKKLAEEAGAAAAAANANAENRIESAVQRSDTIAANTEVSKGKSATCLSGETTLGGGFFIGGSNTNVTVDASERAIYVNGWFVSAHAFSGTPSWSLTTYVMCGTK
jgi:hypothetical protein